MATPELMRACGLSLWNLMEVVPVIIRKGCGAMEPYQWFLLGMMVAWTPGMLALALMLRRHHTIDSADNISRKLSHTSVPLHKSDSSSASSITKAGHRE